ncbi:hypothetical protein MLD52_23255, partial [Puniceicoccaceae bacterium K14]|nr:hypothetical protein [Puniceicoccaceae bacterium K14]
LAEIEMTISELESTLPNGFHDALLHSYEIDSNAKTATLKLDIWIGDMGSETTRESYKSGVLRMEDLAYFIVDEPDPTYEYRSPERIDLCTALPEYPKEIKDGYFRGRFYSDSTNAFIHFSASTVTFKYTNQCQPLH